MVHRIISLSAVGAAFRVVAGHHTTALSGTSSKSQYAPTSSNIHRYTCSNTPGFVPRQVRRSTTVRPGDSGATRVLLAPQERPDGAARQGKARAAKQRKYSSERCCSCRKVCAFGAIWHAAHHQRVMVAYLYCVAFLWLSSGKSLCAWCLSCPSWCRISSAESGASGLKNRHRKPMTPRCSHVAACPWKPVSVLGVLYVVSATEIRNTSPYFDQSAPKQKNGFATVDLSPRAEAGRSSRTNLATRFRQPQPQQPQPQVKAENRRRTCRRPPLKRTRQRKLAAGPRTETVPATAVASNPPARRATESPPKRERGAVLSHAGWPT